MVQKDASGNSTQSVIKSASKSKSWGSYGNFSTQTAGFQLAVPAADVSKIVYGESRTLYGLPKRTIRYIQLRHYSFGLPIQFATPNIQNFRHICSRHCRLESSHLGTKIAIIFPIFYFQKLIFYHKLCRITTRVFLDHIQVPWTIFRRVMTGNPEIQKVPNFYPMHLLPCAGDTTLVRDSGI